MKRAEIQLVQMTSSHVDKCARIIGQIDIFADYQLTPERASASLFNALQTAGNDLFVALRDQVICGFAWFVPKGAFARSGYLRLIAVSPQEYGKGVGRKLMEELEKRYLEPAGLVLLTSEHNQSAHKFYERLNYTQVGLIPNYVKDGLHERIYFKPAI